MVSNHDVTIVLMTDEAETRVAAQGRHRCQHMNENLCDGARDILVRGGHEAAIVTPRRIKVDARQTDVGELAIVEPHQLGHFLPAGEEIANSAADGLERPADEPGRDAQKFAHFLAAKLLGRSQNGSGLLPRNVRR